MGWTRKSVAATILLVTEEQRRGMAARLAQRMDERNLTNALVAQQAGVAEKTVSRILNARHEPRGTTIEKVAVAVGYTPDEFRGPTPPPLGLGAETQLDRIERMLEELLKQVSQPAEDASAPAVPQPPGELGRRATSRRTKRVGQEPKRTPAEAERGPRAA